MRIAVAQVVTAENVRENLKLIKRWTAQAAAAGAQLVVFPEATQRAFGYPLAPIAEDIHGPWAHEVQQVANQHGVVLVLGMFTPGDPTEDGKPRVKNTLLAVGPSLLASYDKLHLYDAFGFQESAKVQAGDRIVRFPSHDLIFGLATCYDVRFPQLFQALACAGAHATLLPTSWAPGPGKVAQWRTLVVSRALDSTQYIIASGQGASHAVKADAPERPTGVGHSMIVSPTGQILAEAGENPQLLVADIDAETVREARRVLPVLQNRRHNSVYGVG